MADYKTINYPVTPLYLNQQTMAKSLSIAIASDQTPIPITGTVAVTTSNASVGLNGAAIPTSSTLIGGSDGTDLLPLTVTTVGPITALDVNIAAGAITATNPSVSLTGATVPTSATFIGGKDSSNNLTGLKVTTSGAALILPEGYVDSGNSTTTPLGVSGVYTGIWIDVSNYSAIFLGVKSDVASITDGLIAQFSHDGVTVDHEHKFTFTGPSGIGLAITAEYKYYRVKYTNSTVAQASFTIQSILKPNMILPSTYNLTYPLTSNFQAIVTRSVITGVTTGGGGGYVNVKVNPSGALVTEASAIITNSKGEFVRNDYTVNNVDTTTYYELIAATADAYTAIEIFDSSGQTLVFAIGAAASEIDQFIIFPGGNGRIPFTLASGERVSIKALSATANAGEIDINFYK